MDKKDFQIIEVTGCSGGECYLVRYDDSVVLCDTGFSFSAPAAVNNVRKAVGDGGPEYILLTHAHYDHAGGAPYIRAAFPNTKLVANELTVNIFSRPGAIKVMRELSSAAKDELAATGIVKNTSSAPLPSSDMLDRFSADIIVPSEADGARAAKGITAYASPGHTRDTTSYYFNDLDLLFVTETTGVLIGDTVDPTFITSYTQALVAAEKMKETGAQYILMPHFGLIEGDAALSFPNMARESIESFADFVMSRHRSGLSYEEILRDYLTEYYDNLIKPTGKQPLAAVLANAKVMIPRVIAELED